MENHIETNFREIQKILDSCIAHDYKTKVDALFLKREYLTQAQLKDYLRQEIFRVTENIVAIQQKYRVVRNIVLDMDIPDFLWESGYFEDLNSDERKKYIGFREGTEKVSLQLFKELNLHIACILFGYVQIFCTLMP